jgi:hypothetical protein
LPQLNAMVMRHLPTNRKETDMNKKEGRWVGLRHSRAEWLFKIISESKYFHFNEFRFRLQ